MKWLIGGGTVVLVALAILAGVAGTKILSGNGATPSGAPTNNYGLPTCGSEAPKYSPPIQPSSFDLDVIVTGQNCTDTTSCVYTYGVRVTGYSTVAAPLNPAATVIYTVTGADQPVTAYFVVNKDGTVWNPSGMANVAIGPQNATFVTTVTRVEPS